jgi:hypothetical protein
VIRKKRNYKDNGTTPCKCGEHSKHGMRVRGGARKDASHNSDSTVSHCILQEKRGIALATALKTSIIILILAAAPAANAGPFATAVISSSGLVPGYEDASTVLGSPTLTLYDPWANSFQGADVDISMVYGPWTADKIVNLSPSGEITVRFDSPVTNDPRHYYGADFIIFGNAAFSGADSNVWVDFNTDMASYIINDTGSAFSLDTMSVSVSQDGNMWHTFAGPTAGGYWPTQAFSAWDANAGAWDHNSVSDFTKPMLPSLTPGQLGGLSVVDALALYNGSGGGTAFDIEELGLDWVEYVKVEGPGVIDGFSKVSVTPEPATMALLLIGGAGLFIRCRRRK